MVKESDVSIMVVWEASFPSLFQSTTSKTSITQQRFPCPVHQDNREICMSIHLKVGGLQRRQNEGTVEAEPMILSPVPTENWAAAATGSETLVPPALALLWLWPLLVVVVPTNLTTLEAVETPLILNPPHYPHHPTVVAVPTTKENLDAA